MLYLSPREKGKLSPTPTSKTLHRLFFSTYIAHARNMSLVLKKLNIFILVCCFKLNSKMELTLTRTTKSSNLEDILSYVIRERHHKKKCIIKFVKATSGSQPGEIGTHFYNFQVENLFTFHRPAFSVALELRATVHLLIFYTA